MKHAVIRWNPATREHFCVRCGRTSDAISIADAQERLEKYDCIVPSVDVTIPEPGTKTIRLNRKKRLPDSIMDPDSEGRIEISNELARLLGQQTEFFKNGARRGHTPDELREYERSRARVRELFELLEQLRKTG